MSQIKLADGDTFKLTKADIDSDKIEFENGIWVILADDLMGFYKKCCTIVFSPKKPKGKRYNDIR